MKLRTRTAIIPAVLAALSGCASCDSVPAAAVNDCNPQIVVSARTDILFIIDDSGSMAGEQAELAANLSDFIEALLTTSAVNLDLHVGVTNTSVTNYVGGAAQYGANNAAGAAFPGIANTPYPAGALVAILQDPEGVGSAGRFNWAFDPFVSTSTWRGLRILSNGPTLGADFKANALQGDWGNGKEQPLAALRLALEKSGPGGVNAGFRRPGARLAVVIITDEDDCSESSGPYDMTSQTSCANETYKATRLDALAPLVATLDASDGGPPFVAVIAGFDPTSAPTLAPTGCTSGSTSSLQDPTRLDEFLTYLGSTHPNRVYKDSICNDFGPSLLAIAQKLVPQQILLEQEPADWRMLVASVVRSDGSVDPCRIALEGTSQAAAYEAVYTPSRPGVPATLRFQQGCQLAGHDRIDLRIICAR